MIQAAGKKGMRQFWCIPFLLCAQFLLLIGLLIDGHDFCE